MSGLGRSAQDMNRDPMYRERSSALSLPAYCSGDNTKKDETTSVWYALHIHSSNSPIAYQFSYDES